MKILIVSDTHRKNDNYFTLVERIHPDIVIHCGDSEGSEYAISEAAGCPVQMVMGNNDFFCNLPRELEFCIEQYKVWVTHGHNYYVSMNLETLKSEARHRGVDIVMFGHTHRPFLEITDDLVVLNPGSLSYPRQEGRKATYAMMEIDRHGKAHYWLKSM